MQELRNTGIVSELPQARPAQGDALPTGAAAAAASVTVRAAAPRSEAAFVPGPAAAGDAPRGVLVTFEGGDGAGKTTHIRFLAETLRKHGREVLCLREPGGTDIGEQLRGVVLSPANDAMADATELLVYEAARAQIVAEVIAPALARGAVVLCDRFTDSTVAYQGFGRGLDRAFVDAANAFACQGIRPDRTILLVSGVPVAEALDRATRHAGADRLERAGEDFHARVNAGFLSLAQRDPQRIRVVESGGLKSQTAAAVLRELADLFPWAAGLAEADPAAFERLDAQRSHAGRIDLRDAGAERVSVAGPGPAAGSPAAAAAQQDGAEGQA